MMHLCPGCPQTECRPSPLNGANSSHVQCQSQFRDDGSGKGVATCQAFATIPVACMHVHLHGNCTVACTFCSSAFSMLNMKARLGSVLFAQKPVRCGDTNRQVVSTSCNFHGTSAEQRHCYVDSNTRAPRRCFHVSLLSGVSAASNGHLQTASVH